jgi:phosphate transport system protein
LRRSYDRELDTLERRIAQMGGIAEKMVVDAMDSLANSDSASQLIAPTLTPPMCDTRRRCATR